LDDDIVLDKYCGDGGDLVVAIAMDGGNSGSSSSAVAAILFGRDAVK